MLSIIVNFYNMRREAERTLASLSTHYQTGVYSSDYEIIAIDNGSSEPLDQDFVTGLGPNFRYLYHSTESVSPARAVNIGVELAKGDDIAVLVDGARMATPGLVQMTRHALNLSANPFVCALSWHLGPDVQGVAIENGYNAEYEDNMLDSIGWPEDGYRLFEISTLAPSSQPGFLGGMPAECSWFAMRKAEFTKIGGFDERFQSSGGGLVNHEFANRVHETQSFQSAALLGEGVFHQIHGGTATNAPLNNHPFGRFKAEYYEILGRHWQLFKAPPVTYVGSMHPAARRFIALPDQSDNVEL